MMKLSIKEAQTLALPPTLAGSPAFEIWRDREGAIYAYGGVFGEECWMHVRGLASFRFTPHGNEVAAAVVEGAAEDAVVDAYRRRILPMALHVSGREILHASAVSSRAGVTALCGAPFAGKSTLAFGLSRRGYPLWGDDVLAYQISNGDALAVSLPFEIRLRPASADFFGHDATAASAMGTAEHTPGTKTVRLASLLVLERNDELEVPVTVRRLPVAQAFPKILVHACWFSIRTFEGKRRLIDNYLDLAARTPIFQLTFKPGLDNLPAILDAIEQVVTDADAKA